MRTRAIILLAAFAVLLIVPASSQAGATLTNNGCLIHSYTPIIEAATNNFGQWQAKGDVDCDTAGATMQLEVCMRFKTTGKTLRDSCRVTTVVTNKPLVRIDELSHIVGLNENVWYNSWVWAYTKTKHDGNDRATNWTNPAVCIRSSFALCAGSSG